MIDDSANPSSIFNSSHSFKHTDATVYPDPDQDQRKETKKRKVQEGENGVVAGSVTENARYAEHVLANTHLVKVHDFLKAEYEQLGISCVCVHLTLSHGHWEADAHIG